MFDLMTAILPAAAFGSVLDPAAAELVKTAFIGTCTLVAAGAALALLPWTDAEIEEVDTAARQAAGRAAARLIPAEASARVTLQ